MEDAGGYRPEGDQLPHRAAVEAHAASRRTPPFADTDNFTDWFDVAPTARCGGTDPLTPVFQASPGGPDGPLPPAPGRAATAATSSSRSTATSGTGSPTSTTPPSSAATASPSGKARTWGHGPTNHFDVAAPQRRRRQVPDHRRLPLPRLRRHRLRLRPLGSPEGLAVIRIATFALVLAFMAGAGASRPFLRDPSRMASPWSCRSSR